MGRHEQCWRRESGNLDGRRRHLESVPNFQQPEAVAGVGVLALRVGESATRKARNSGSCYRCEWQAADGVALGRMAGWSDGVSHGGGGSGVGQAEQAAEEVG